MTPDIQILDTRPVRLGRHPATRYRLRRDVPYTGDAELDLSFSTFDAVVLAPDRAGAPVVTLMNGITRDMTRSVPAAIALSEAGIGAVLLDTPLGGIRRPTRGHPGEDLAELARRGLQPDLAFVGRVFDGVAADLPAVLALAADVHGLTGPRALFGVSFGCVLSSLAFARDGVGERLLGVIGHPDLGGMSRGLMDGFARFSGLPPTLVATGLRLGPVAESAARRYGGDAAVGGLRFARLLQRLSRGGPALDAVDPLSFAGRVSPDRPARFLAGERDPVAPPEAVGQAAARFATHAVEVAPGLGHGWYPAARPASARPFPDLCADWLLRHLADWAA